MKYELLLVSFTLTCSLRSHHDFITVLSYLNMNINIVPNIQKIICQLKGKIQPFYYTQIFLNINNLHNKTMNINLLPVGIS